MTMTNAPQEFYGTSYGRSATENYERYFFRLLAVRSLNSSLPRRRCVRANASWTLRAEPASSRASRPIVLVRPGASQARTSTREC